jgi:2-amino-4-hydroxy-6-hydroxymethyldihydropteridine diphosphokinase
LILIGIGANLTSPIFGKPRTTCGAALESLTKEGLLITARSSWYKSAPVPDSDQPWFINAVVQVKTKIVPEKLMKLLLQIESNFGRSRNKKNAPRTLDLDLIAYNKLILSLKNKNTPALNIPHPRLSERAFVLLPIYDIAPNWRHPAENLSLKEMISKLPKEQITEHLADANGAFGTEWKE